LADSLKFVHKNGYEWNISACAKAARTGNLEILRYLHENGCPWAFTTCYLHLFYKMPWERIFVISFLKLFHKAYLMGKVE